MMPARRGLIVEVTENDMIGGGSPMSQAVKMAQKVLPLFWAAELATRGITVIAVTPGFLRSESMLEFGVTEGNWRHGGKKDANFLQSESPLFVGRAVAALAADPDVRSRTGMLFGSWELGRDYGLTDYDGRRPDWGRHKIDFSVLPATWIEVFRTGTDLEIKWLTTLPARPLCPLRGEPLTDDAILHAPGAIRPGDESHRESDGRVPVVGPLDPGATSRRASDRARPDTDRRIPP